MVAMLDTFAVRERHSEMTVLKVHRRRLNNLPRTHRNALVDETAAVWALSGRQLPILDKVLQRRNIRVEDLPRVNINISNKI